MIISVDSEKDFNKVQYSFMMKDIKKRHEKTLCGKPLMNIIINEKKIKIFSSKIRNKI